MSDNIAARTLVHTYQVHGRELQVTKTVWTNSEGLSYDVADAETGLALNDESFDTLPSRAQVEALITALISSYNERDTGDASFFALAIFLNNLDHVIEINLSVENTYELYEIETVQHEYKVILAPPNYTVHWQIVSGIDGESMKDGTDYVFAFSPEAAGQAAILLAQMHTEYDPRINPRVRIVEITEIDPKNTNLEEWDDWSRMNIFDPFTGVGHTKGKSWYDVTVTACSDETLLGKTFEWGY